MLYYAEIFLECCYVLRNPSEIAIFFCLFHLVKNVVGLLSEGAQNGRLKNNGTEWPDVMFSFSLLIMKNDGFLSGTEMLKIQEFLVKELMCYHKCTFITL
jgi:hypothetical protein